MRKHLLCAVVTVLSLGTVGQVLFPTEFFDYLAKTQGQATWEIGPVQELGLGRATEVGLVAQVWRGVPWRHRLLVCEPRTIEFPDIVLLFISGGRAATDVVLGLAAAQETGARVAILNDVPNQPLFGRHEDALIAYTFERYLAEGDPDWPLLFPMTGSALAAMEALEALAAERWDVKLRGFIVSGASKRGWTAYLTAAAAPAKVLGLVPMVFDALNLPAHVGHQLAFWGEPSPMIRDYEGLFSTLDSSEGARLAWLVDPYTYRYALSMPKLVVVGTNDPYWPVNSTGLYWEGLPEPKGVMRVPNAGHALGDWVRTMKVIASFARLVIHGRPMPTLEARFSDAPEGVRIEVQADRPPKAARLWTALDPKRDFRFAYWQEQSLVGQGGKFVAVLPYPERGYLAAFVELVFEIEGQELALSSEVRVTPGW